jgi:hypothetical protein
VLLLSAAFAGKLALVPGCPVQEDGLLGPCLGGKVAWAFSLYEDGLVEGFITSGNAVYSPYNEAYAAAMGLQALGVPPEKIWLDPLALHTDENAYNAMLIADSLGHELVVAATKSQAMGICAYVRSWDHACEEAPINYGRVGEVMAGDGIVLAAVDPPVDPEFISLDEREAARFEETGWVRPGSVKLYVLDGIRSTTGEPRVPYAGEGVGAVVPFVPPVAVETETTD